LYAEGIFFNNSIINTLSETMFDGVQGVKTFVSDYYKFCCVRPSTVTEENCYPHEDEFSSCDDLIRNEILRPLIWIIGLFTLISNIISLFCRFIYQREQLKHSYCIFVSHLALSDFLMGMYLIIVAGADITLRGQYIFHKDWWLQSAWCKLAGVLSTMSSEASVLFICLITLDRLLAVKYPFGQRRLSLNVGHALAIIVWIIAIVLALLPLTFTSYFHDDFYSQSGVCLALPLTSERVSGWLYSVAIFVVFNIVSCLLLAVGQWIIYSEIKASAKASGTSRRQEKRSKDTRMAWNLLLVVSTDFLCWLPIGFLGR
ncbi:MAG: 7 transmembrane receptor, partial [Candidatus Thiodiazotropha sp.]